VEHRYFSLVLHSHIPYVIGHGTWPHGMDWLYEAAAESYLPLLGVFRRLADAGASPQVNVSFTPVLMEQLNNPAFPEGFVAYLRMKIEAARNDRQHFEKNGQKNFIGLALFWEDWYEKLLRDFCDTYQGDILDGFRVLQDAGHIEILTSGATHAYFPLLSRDESISAQIRQGKHTYAHYLGREPKGFWIPECAYRPAYAWRRPFGSTEPYSRRGVDEILMDEGIGYFFIDTHLLKGGEAKGVYADRFPALKQLWEKFKEQQMPEKGGILSPYFPYLAYPSDAPFFTRDEVTGTQVWSRSTGYPGNGLYLEFHKKHFPGGLRYWRITGAGADLADKKPYDPEQTRAQIEEHAVHFVNILEGILREQNTGIIVALYDTELFGHWWFEGPEWLYHVLKSADQSRVKPLTASLGLERIPPQSIVSLPEGSWGEGGFHGIWFNEETSWIWEKVYALEDETANLDIQGLGRDGLARRLLRQFFREKFLLESSDWPFLISTWSARDYAERRVAEHFKRGETLARWIRLNRALTPEETSLLESWEREDCLFKEIASPGCEIP
jgi:1,4-alpha-glucan branching enzyme